MKENLKKEFSKKLKDQLKKIDDEAEKPNNTAPLYCELNNLISVCEYYGAKKTEDTARIYTNNLIHALDRVDDARQELYNAINIVIDTLQE